MAVSIYLKGMFATADNIYYRVSSGRDKNKKGEIKIHAKLNLKGNVHKGRQTNANYTKNAFQISRL